MEYENMKLTELKALARECGLRGYSWMRKADIIELISNNQQSWAPDIPQCSVTPPQLMQPNQTQSVRFRPNHPPAGGGKGPYSTRNGYI